MRGDFSRFGFDADKNYIAVLMQQGRVLLDADHNENVESFLNTLWKESRDMLGTSACVGDSFRIGLDIVLDHMISPELWRIVGNDKGQKSGRIFLDTEDRPKQFTFSTLEKASLYVEGANSIERDFANLDLSRTKYIFLKFRPFSANPDNTDRSVGLTLFQRVGNTEVPATITGEYVESVDAGGFFTLRFDIQRSIRTIVDLNQPNFNFSHISRISINWKLQSAVCIGIITMEPLVPIITAFDSWTDGSVNSYAPKVPNLDVSISSFDGKPAIWKRSEVVKMVWKLSRPRDFSGIEELNFASSKDLSDAAIIFLSNSDGKEKEIHLKEEPHSEKASWYFYSANIKEARANDQSKDFDFSLVDTVGLRNIPKTEIYLSEILGKLDFEKDFLISPDISLGQSSRMYVEGVLCMQNKWDTFLNQKDYPSVLDKTILDSTSKGSASQDINYLVYADVWQRGVTYLEDPEIREIALGGPDTTTRIKTVCQIKLKEVSDNLESRSAREIANGEVARMRSERSGTLSTFSENIASIISEVPSSASIINDNRLYRVEIHDGGDNKKPASFKWSKDNGSTAFGAIEVSESGVILERLDRRLYEVFKIGDIIEVIDDLDELMAQPKGQLRRVTSIDLDKGLLTWNSRSKQQSGEIMAYLHEGIKKKYLSRNHPKVIRWDGIGLVTNTRKEPATDQDSGYISLDDDTSNNSVKIRFGEGIFRTGDYWAFSTRSLTNSVQSLRSAPPQGVKHYYSPLALLQKKEGKSIAVIEDLRQTFSPLTNLRALDIRYDPRKETSEPTNLQSALETLFENKRETLNLRTGKGNQGGKLGRIEQLYIQAGEYYELKANQKLRIFFKYNYQNQPFLIYSVLSKEGRAVEHNINDVILKDNSEIVTVAADDTLSIYEWEGFDVVSSEDAKLTWMAVGDSLKYYEYYTKVILGRLFQVLFGKELAGKLMADNEDVKNKWKLLLTQYFGQAVADKWTADWDEEFIKWIQRTG